MNYDRQPPVRSDGKVRPRRGQHGEFAVHSLRMEYAIVVVGPRRSVPQRGRRGSNAGSVCREVDGIVTLTIPVNVNVELV